MNRLAYYQKQYLRCSGATEQDEPIEVEGTLLVAEEKSICDWISDQSQYGCNYNNLYPAFKDGEKCFLLVSEWDPAQGYSADGIDDTILTMQEGIELLCKNDAWEWLWNNPISEEE